MLREGELVMRQDGRAAGWRGWFDAVWEGDSKVRVFVDRCVEKPGW